jgi:hypothetical protein
MCKAIKVFELLQRCWLVQKLSSVDVQHDDIKFQKFWYNHPALININRFHEKSPLSDSSVNKPNFSIRSAFHCRAHNFAHFIKFFAECHGKQWALISLHCHATWTGWRDRVCRHRQIVRSGDRQSTGEWRSCLFWSYCGGGGCIDRKVDYRGLTVLW